jgi:CobQ-like glutamine amidotransferase family enzyme
MFQKENKFMKRVLIIICFLVCILVVGCSGSKVIGYTYEMGENNDLIRLLDINSIEYEIKDNKVVGKIIIDNNIVKINADMSDTQVDYDMFHGKWEYDDTNYNFDIAFYKSGSATGLFYDDSKKFVNGFVIEELPK